MNPLLTETDSCKLSWLVYRAEMITRRGNSALVANPQMTALHLRQRGAPAESI